MARMVVGTSTIDLHLHGVQSLKQKRGIVKSLITQLRKKFNAAVAEVELHDVWQSACIGVSVISTSPGHAQEMLENIGYWIEDHRPDVDMVEQMIETITL